MARLTNQSSQIFQKGRVVVLSAAHAVHDTFTAFLPPLLPVFIQRFSLLKTEAGLLAVLLQIPSVIQPVIGHLSDRRNLMILVIIAPAIAAVTMSLVGLSPAYAVAVFVLFLAGLNSAAFHAIAPVIAGRFSGSRLGKGMGFWMVGGEFGRTVGPILLVSSIAIFSLTYVPVLMILGITASLLLFWQLRNMPLQNEPGSNNVHFFRAIKQMYRLMLPLSGIIFLRGFMITALTTYLPTFLQERGTSLWLAGASLTVLEGAGVVGALLGGSISDKWGRRKVLIVAQSISVIFMFIFLHSSGWIHFPLLIMLGLSLLSLTPVIMALVQESYPENRALANGVYMLLSFTLRSVVILIFGAIGDLFGLLVSFQISPFLMLIGIPLVLLLPKPPQQTHSSISKSPAK